MEECEGAEGKVKQSMTPPLPAAVREACLVLDAPTSSGNILDARREEELSQEAAWGEPGAGVQDLDLRRGSWGGCEPITPIRSFPLHSPPKPQESQALPLLQPSQPPGTHAESSAKITFPGKCFYLLNRILRKYCTQQWISNLFCSRRTFLSVNKQVHQLTVWQAVSKKYLTGTQRVLKNVLSK